MYRSFRFVSLVALACAAAASAMSAAVDRVASAVSYGIDRLLSAMLASNLDVHIRPRHSNNPIIALSAHRHTLTHAQGKPAHSKQWQKFSPLCQHAGLL